MTTALGHEVATLTADVVVFAPTSIGWRVLLVQRAKDPFAGKWALPGGRVEKGETFREAALRELKEETGLVCPTVRTVKHYDRPDRDPRGRYISVAFMVTTSKHRTTEAGVGDEGVRDTDWALVEDLLANPRGLAFDHGTILRDAYRRLLGGN